MNSKLFEQLALIPKKHGAFKASVIETLKIELDNTFRDICATNACGMFGKCWMCPPDIGNINTLMDSVKEYKYALVYQTVTDIEDSFDFEGMINAKKQSVIIAQNIRKDLEEFNIPKVLYLVAGGCGVCDVCAKRSNEPCRFPDIAMPSLEAYGVNVSRLAVVSDMKYINGVNTITYFGAVLFSLEVL